MFGTAPPPATPDYTGAAIAQGQAAQGLTQEQTYANRPDITTPWGTVQWTPPPERAPAEPFQYAGPSVEDFRAGLGDMPVGVDENKIAQQMYQAAYQQQK